ncbi:hypothetical protein [Streptomyces sp. NPDC005955]|uniref:hypothetical protein n=1 Tax=Streptomyces sp. NPDC005955 TaxID=3364738 RepID=UPI0036B8B33D
MIDINSGEIIMTKVIRRKVFILGKSEALLRADAVEMSDGTLRVVNFRRPEFWDYNRRTVLVVSYQYRRRETFAELVETLRRLELRWITAELPEKSC